MTAGIEFFSTLFAIFAVSAACISYNNVYDESMKFNLKFKKRYVEGSEEFKDRFEKFKTNLLSIGHIHTNSSTKANNLTAVYGITKFSDLSPQEFKEWYLQDIVQKHVRPELRNKHTQPHRLTSLKVPPMLDWRTYLNHSIVTPVKNQKKCGACWAFSTIETVESMYAKEKGVSPPSLSVQEVIDCAYNNKGCSGGDTCQALEWMRTSGTPIVTDSDYPLTDTSNFCKILTNGTKGVHVESFTCTDFVGKEDQLVELLYKVGPVSVAVDATTWSNYQGGVIQWHCDNNNNHAVQIVGYDISGEIPFYIVRNSWGTDFGNNGYMKIKIGENVCGIAQEVSRVTVRR